MKLRELKEGDLPFLYNSWLKSYRNSRLTKNWTNEQYYSAQKLTIDALLRISETKVLVDPEDQNHIFGYIVFQTNVDPGPVVHYIYVKQPFRRLGMAKFMLQNSWLDLTKCEAIYTTHWRPLCEFLKMRPYVYDKVG